MPCCDTQTLQPDVADSRHSAGVLTHECVLRQVQQQMRPMITAARAGDDSNKSRNRIGRCIIASAVRVFLKRQVDCHLII